MLSPFETVFPPAATVIPSPESLLALTIVILTSFALEVTFAFPEGTFAPAPPRKILSTPF